MYNRYVKRTSKFMAHDETDECNIGDRVSSPSAIAPFQPPPPSAPICFCAFRSCSVQTVSIIVGFGLSSGMMDHVKSLIGCRAPKDVSMLAFLFALCYKFLSIVPFGASWFVVSVKWVCLLQFLPNSSLCICVNRCNDVRVHMVVITYGVLLTDCLGCLIKV